MYACFVLFPQLVDITVIVADFWARHEVLHGLVYTLALLKCLISGKCKLHTAEAVKSLNSVFDIYRSYILTVLIEELAVSFSHVFRTFNQYSQFLLDCFRWVPQVVNNHVEEDLAILKLLSIIDRVTGLRHHGFAACVALLLVLHEESDFLVVVDVLQ